MRLLGDLDMVPHATSRLPSQETQLPDSSLSDETAGLRGKGKRQGTRHMFHILVLPRALENEKGSRRFGSEALFNTFSICSCLEAIDKYVPLCSKYGNSEYKQKIEDCFEADVASAEPSPNAGSRQPSPAEGERFLLLTVTY
ncbi:hypothetical protein E5288_WYG016811 [Bos mutus]|uniref:Uncharacterized protein n=1 Tax=Bos mutus TaxID=72004 RepID=A0A6B0R4N2_9CETA|nr:hypothetical protein [Bos mutus]